MWCSGSRLWARCSLITSPNPSEDPAGEDPAGGSYQPPLLCLCKQSGEGLGSCWGSQSWGGRARVQAHSCTQQWLVEHLLRARHAAAVGRPPNPLEAFTSFPTLFLPVPPPGHRLSCCSGDSEGWSHFLSPLSTTATSLEGTLRIHVAEPAYRSVQAQVALQAGLGAVATFPSPRPGLRAQQH